MLTISVPSIMRFILSNGDKGKTAFPGWPLTGIFDCIQYSLSSGEICIATMGEEIIGVMIVEISGGVFYVKHLLVKNKLAVLRFIMYYNMKYKGYEIRGQRRGKVRIYRNIQHFLNLLLVIN